jgi:hypothetical protein
MNECIRLWLSTGASQGKRGVRVWQARLPRRPPACFEVCQTQCVCRARHVEQLTMCTGSGGVVACMQPIWADLLMQRCTPPSGAAFL